MDRFDLDGQVVYVAHDRTSVFIERLDQAQVLTIHWARQHEIDALWQKHRLVALLAVCKKLQSLDVHLWGRRILPAISPEGFHCLGKDETCERAEGQNDLARQ
jgi:hypothetical protein